MNNKLLTIDDYNNTNDNYLSIIMLNICSFNKHVNKFKRIFKWFYY